MSGTGAEGPRVEDLVVKDVGNDVHLFVDPGTGRVVGTLYAEGGGWWCGRAPSGEVLRFQVPEDVAEPWRAAAERLRGA
ncbi:hypothetical protein [Actinomadura parmotrematis]|uniref:Uncharacterized protein n=1 Tax=Actinomadura parmotrematis TaxID=2864039 RepID=A0ABS7G1K9_9ACTN|nr:hypothetical protein [Actinomadura parmotrematis]MBW8485769.1 hypothetical protein [Actinomadura parmotrematis]